MLELGVCMHLVFAAVELLRSECCRKGIDLRTEAHVST